MAPKVATLAAFGFKRVSAEECERQRKRAQEKRKEQEKVLEERHAAYLAAHPPPAKRPVGRPKKVRRTEATLLPVQIDAADVAAGAQRTAGTAAGGGVVDLTGRAAAAEEAGGVEATVVKPPSKKSLRGTKRGKYTNWFDPTLWPLIAAAVEQHKRSGLRTALQYLQTTHREKGRLTGPFDKLSHGSLSHWYTEHGELRQKYRLAVGKETAHGGGIPPALSSVPDVVAFIEEILQGLRDAGQAVNAPLCVPIIQGILEEKAPGILKENGGSLRVGVSWIKEFLAEEMRWTWRASTTAAQKLPWDWEVQGLDIARRVAVMVRVHPIPDKLVVNSDQTAAYFIPMGGERSYDVKGIKDVHVIGAKDKRQITDTVSSSAAGDLLPLQLVFTGKDVLRVIPKGQAAAAALAEGFDYTCTPNHWASFGTVCRFVEKILLPYCQKVIRELNLPANQKMVWLLDCWKVHIGKEFTSWIKKEHPEIIVLYIPANCTSKLQPADVCLQRPLKYRLKQGFNKSLAKDMGGQLAAGVAPKDVKCNFKIGPLREGICGWLLGAWKEVQMMDNMIKRGWRRSMLGPELFDREFQNTALEHQADLFTRVPQVEEHNGEEDPTVGDGLSDDVYEWDDDLPIGELQRRALPPRAGA